MSERIPASDIDLLSIFRKLFHHASLGLRGLDCHHGEARVLEAVGVAGVAGIAEGAEGGGGVVDGGGGGVGVGGGGGEGVGGGEGGGGVGEGVGDDLEGLGGGDDVGGGGGLLGGQAAGGGAVEGGLGRAISLFEKQDGQDSFSRRRWNVSSWAFLFFWGGRAAHSHDSCPTHVSSTS